MTTIIINAITHRAACTDALGAADLAAYDNDAARFFARLAKAAKTEGFGFEIDATGQGAASYRVTDEDDSDDLQSAHDFMQSDRADFWSNY